MIASGVIERIHSLGEISDLILARVHRCPGTAHHHITIDGLKVCNDLGNCMISIMPCLLLDMDVM